MFCSENLPFIGNPKISRLVRSKANEDYNIIYLVQCIFLFIFFIFPVLCLFPVLDF